MKKSAISITIAIALGTLTIIGFNRPGVKVPTTGTKPSAENSKGTEGFGVSTNPQKQKVERARDTIDAKKAFSDLGHSKLSPAELDLERVRLMLLIAETDGFEVAMRLLNEQVGEGLTRSNLISTIFRGLRENVADSLAKVESLPANQRVFAMMGLFGRVDYRKLPTSEIAVLFTSKQAKDNPNPLITGLRMEFTNAHDAAEVQAKFDRIGEVLSLIPSEDRALFVATNLFAAAKAFPFQSWACLSSLDLSGVAETDKLVKAKNEIIASMIASDTNKSLETFMKSKNAPPNAFWDALVDLYGRDSKRAELWVEENTGNLAPLQKDQVLSARLDSLLKGDHLADAAAIADDIIDESLREKASSAIFKVEKGQYLDRAKTDPVGALGEIVESNTSRSGLLMLEVMSAWMAKDAEQAEEWYASNWNSLPAEKAQFVAAAYAKDAVVKGDAATAKKWAAFISDKNLRDQVLSGIKKTAGK